MEITAALFLPIAPAMQVAAEPSQLLFASVLNEATSIEPAEPSAWTLLNPMAAPPPEGEETLPQPAEMLEEPEASDELLFIPPQLSILAPKPPLQFENLSKELTDGVKKLPLDSPAVDGGRQYPPTISGDGEAPSDLTSAWDKAEATPEQKSQSTVADPQYVAFAARVSKPRNVPDEAQAGHPLKPLQRSMPGVSTPELRLSKSTTDTDHSKLERPVPFVQTPQMVETENSVGDSARQTTSTSTPVPEQRDIRAAKPVRQISLDVEGSEGLLRIRIAERAGEMRAWVAGQTPATVEKVQAGLSDLTRALTNAGFESEVWTPHVVSAPASASDLQASTEQSDQNLFGGSHSDPGDGHRGGQDNNRSRSDEDDDESNFRSHLRIS